MGSISIDIISPNVYQDTGEGKIVMLNSSGKIKLVDISHVLNNVKKENVAEFVDKIDDPILENVKEEFKEQIDDMVEEHLENIDPTGNLNWNEVYD